MLIHMNFVKKLNLKHKILTQQNVQLNKKKICVTCQNVFHRRQIYIQCIIKQNLEEASKLILIFESIKSDKAFTSNGCKIKTQIQRIVVCTVYEIIYHFVYIF